MKNTRTYFLFCKIITTSMLLFVTQARSEKIFVIHKADKDNYHQVAAIDSFWFNLSSVPSPLFLLSQKGASSSHTLSEIDSIVFKEDSVVNQLYFREDWKEISEEIPVTQAHVAHPQLLVARHGPGGDLIKKSHHDFIPNDPYYIYSGLTDTFWALSLQKSNGLVDLSLGGYIRWRSKQSGSRVLRVVLQMENGDWVVSDQGVGTTDDWEVSIFKLDTLTWSQMDSDSVIQKNSINPISLNRIKSIGFSDMMAGVGSDECSRLDWIEVWGREIQIGN